MASIFDSCKGSNSVFSEDFSGVVDEKRARWKGIEVLKWETEDVANFFTTLGCKREVINLIKDKNISGIRFFQENEYTMITDTIARTDHDGGLTKFVSECILFLRHECDGCEKPRYSEDFKRVHSSKIVNLRSNFWNLMAPKELVKWIRGMMYIKCMKSFFFGMENPTEHFNEDDPKNWSDRYRRFVESKHVHFVVCKEKKDFFFGVVVNNFFVTFSTIFSLAIPMFISEEKKEDGNEVLEYFMNYDDKKKDFEEIPIKEDESTKKKKKKKKKVNLKFKNVVMKEIISESESKDDYGLCKDHNFDRIELLQTFPLTQKNEEEVEGEEVEEKKEGSEDQSMRVSWVDRMLRFIINTNCRGITKDYGSSDFVLGLLNTMMVEINQIEYSQIVSQTKKSIGWFSKLN